MSRAELLEEFPEHRGDVPRIIVAAVVGAFEGCGATSLWWRAILWLHGKPNSPLVSENERRQIVADGFRFYAQLYRFVGLLFWPWRAVTPTVNPSCRFYTYNMQARVTHV